MKNAYLREKLRFNRQLEAEREEDIFPMKTSVAQARDFLERAIEFLDKEKCEVFPDCIEWARLKFEDYFANRVKQLTDDYPEDFTGSDDESFWIAPKRFPSPRQFSVYDPSHFNFVMAASWAETFGIPIPDWIKFFWIKQFRLLYTTAFKVKDIKISALTLEKIYQVPLNSLIFCKATYSQMTIPFMKCSNENSLLS